LIKKKSALNVRFNYMRDVAGVRGLFIQGASLITSFHRSTLKYAILATLILKVIFIFSKFGERLHRFCQVGRKS
jgi:hypothetical protein